MTSKKSNGGGKTSPGLSFLQPPLSRDQLLERGKSASRLLESPEFNIAYRSTIQNLQDDILTTEEHETRKREGLYLKMQALGEVVGELAGMYELAKSLSAEELAKERAAQHLEEELATGPLN